MRRQIRLSRIAVEFLQAENLDRRAAALLAAAIKDLAEGDSIACRAFSTVLEMRYLLVGKYRIIYRSTATEAAVMRIELASGYH